MEGNCLRNKLFISVVVRRRIAVGEQNTTANVAKPMTTHAQYWVGLWIQFKDMNVHH